MWPFHFRCRLCHHILRRAAEVANQADVHRHRERLRVVINLLHRLRYTDPFQRGILVFRRRRESEQPVSSRCNYDASQLVVYWIVDMSRMGLFRIHPEATAHQAHIELLLQNILFRLRVVSHFVDRTDDHFCRELQKRGQLW